jgi:phage terminase small subunit
MKKRRRRRPRRVLNELIERPRIRRFLTEYLSNGGKKTAAAIAAGVPPRTAPVWASRILRRPEVLAELEHQHAAAGVTPARVIRELARIGFLDPADLYDENGQLLPVPRMSEDARRAIAGIDVELGKDGGVTKKVRLANKHVALETLAKYTGAIPNEKEQINFGIGLEIHMHLDEIRNSPAQLRGKPAIEVSALPPPRDLDPDPTLN